MASPSLDEFMVAARQDNPGLSDETLSSYWQKTYGAKGAPEQEPGDTWRAVKVTFQQLPQLGYRLAAITAAAAETMLGEDGLATAAKNWAVKGHEGWSESIRRNSKDTDELDVAWGRAKEGDYGALVDWLQYAIGYAAGEAVIDFTEVEAGIFEGLRQGEGVYILQNLAAARSLAKSMDQMIGDWSMVRGNGQAICALVLTNTDAGNDNFQVFMKGKCDPAVATFNPTLWRLDHGQMILMSPKGESWQFEADDNAQWRRIPDSADPLIMLREQ